MRVKNDTVNIKNLDKKLKDAQDVVLKTYRDHGHKGDVVITSGNDGKQMKNSLHFKNKAEDLRSNFLSDSNQVKLADSLQSNLGGDFTVISEHFKNSNRNHIHVSVKKTVNAKKAHVYKEKGLKRKF